MNHVEILIFELVGQNVNIFNINIIQLNSFKLISFISFLYYVQRRFYHVAMGGKGYPYFKKIIIFPFFLFCTSSLI